MYLVVKILLAFIIFMLVVTNIVRLKSQKTHLYNLNNKVKGIRDKIIDINCIMLEETCLELQSKWLHNMNFEFVSKDKFWSYLLTWYSTKTCCLIKKRVYWIDCKEDFGEWKEKITQDEFIVRIIPSLKKIRICNRLAEYDYLDNNIKYKKIYLILSPLPLLFK